MVRRVLATTKTKQCGGVWDFRHACSSQNKRTSTPEYRVVAVISDDKNGLKDQNYLIV